MRAESQPGRTERGQRGFELDFHVTFRRPLGEEEARRALLVLDGFRVELYRPHPDPTGTGRALAGGAVGEGPGGEAGAGIPSARVTGPLRAPDTAAQPELLRAALSALLQGEARSIEGGLHGFLRSAEGVTEWMPWRRNAVLPRAGVAGLGLEEGVRYILE